MSLRTDWKFPRITTASDLDKALPKKLTSRCHETTRRDLVLLDDFDWQIWQTGLLLTQEAKNSLLQLWQADGTCLAECPANEKSRFWWQLPKGELANQLKGVLSLHAFVPKCRFQLTTESLEILTRDEKIVTRCQLYRLSGDDNLTTCMATILPLRGYGKNYGDLLKSLSALQPVAVKPLHLRQLLLEGGLEVETPKTTQNYRLDAEQPAEAAVGSMVQGLLRAARRYEQGMLAEIDTEFVHQYRVNIRKSRSLVGLFKKTLSSQRYLLLKSALKILGSRTNDLRDLDVFLLNENDYREMLPENLQAGLPQVFSRIKRRRTIAQKKVAAALTSDGYQAEFDQLLHTLSSKPEFSSKYSRLPIRALVSKKVLTQYRRVCAAGEAIRPETSDETVHDLRIECKKLRYLLELFSELFARKKIKQLVRLLKTLQDNLGRINDYSIEREFMVGFAQGKNLTREQLASINGLTAVLFNKQLHERSLVEANIARFTAESVSEKFQQLFAKSSEGAAKK